LINGTATINRLEAHGKKKEAIADAMDEGLVRWLGIQRCLRHMLPIELKEKLAALAFDFEAMDSSREAMYGQLTGFVEKNGHACLPDGQRHEALKG
jgi:hypothetical protein